MSDEHALLALLDGFGLAPQIEAAEDQTTVRLAAREGGVDGYSGFACEFEFDKDGKFVRVVVWE